ncbi:hypothetical protein V8C35DRAFT_292056 [Trichoderma chlorosporum]
MDKTAVVDKSVVGNRLAKEPQFKVQIRRWRCYKPAAKLTNSDDGGEAASEPSSTNARSLWTKRVGVEFINTAHPKDATSAAAVSSIRSHAARGVHAARRVSALPPCTESKRRGVRVDTGRGGPQRVITWPASLGIPRLESLFQGVRPITNLEYFLLDYYITIVIPESRNWCDHGEGDLRFYESTRMYWLPFIVSDTGLLAGVLLSACRNLTINDRQGPVDCDYAQVATMYKVECIRSINAAIDADRCSVSDASVAKALMLCTDEALCKNVTASLQHYDGMSRMIQLKGGMPSLGVGGFLGKAYRGCNVQEFLAKYAQ